MSGIPKPHIFQSFSNIKFFSPPNCGHLGFVGKNDAKTAN